jgi:hypothetical protein
MNDELWKVEQLLRRYGHGEGADRAMRARELYARERARAFAAVRGDDWWGDKDSIATLDLGLDGGFSPEARLDGRRLRAALVAIEEEIASQGQSSPQARLVAAQFRKWLASQV